MIAPILLGSGPVEVTLTPAIRDYCHIVRFPNGWKIQDYDPLIHQVPFYGYQSPYEFRTVGLLRTRFLVGGLVPPRMVSTNNKYSIDLSDPAGIAQPATDKEWQDAKIVPETDDADCGKYIGYFRLAIPYKDDKPLPLHGLEFAKSGSHWAVRTALPSHDQAWLVLLSWSGKSAKRGSDDFGGFIYGGRDKGKLFFDVFNANTGKKLITIVARYRDMDPDSAIIQCRWVTEHYFIVPLGSHRERCLVCEFGRVGQNKGAGR
jgi:hypothetical protein